MHKSRRDAVAMKIFPAWTSTGAWVAGSCQHDRMQMEQEKATVLQHRTTFQGKLMVNLKICASNDSKEGIGSIRRKWGGCRRGTSDGYQQPNASY